MLNHDILKQRKTREGLSINIKELYAFKFNIQSKIIITKKDVMTLYFSFYNIPIFLHKSYMLM